MAWTFIASEAVASLNIRVLVKQHDKVFVKFRNKAYCCSAAVRMRSSKRPWKNHVQNSSAFKKKSLHLPT